MSRIRISLTAREWIRLHGGVLTVRIAGRHGCCGGRAGVPVAEARTPDDPNGFEEENIQNIRTYISRDLLEVPMSVHLDGFGRWQRLSVEAPVQPLR
jgi:hypothetical protein